MSPFWTGFAMNFTIMVLIGMLLSNPTAIPFAFGAATAFGLYDLLIKPTINNKWVNIIASVVVAIFFGTFMESVFISLAN